MPWRRRRHVQRPLPVPPGHEGARPLRARALSAAAAAAAAVCGRAAGLTRRLFLAQATYNEETELYEGHETGGSSWGGHDGAYGAPFYDSVDLEWSKEWVSSQPTDLKNLILSGKIRMGRDTTHLEGVRGRPLPCRRAWPSRAHLSAADTRSGRAWT